ncbi:MAG: phosphatase PAP2 family protein [Patescibacteria group bacterium]|jgi:undecaprenyl-diphosphatase
MFIPDTRAFRYLNDLAGQNSILDWVGIFAAKYLIFIMLGYVLAAAALIYWREHQHRREPLLRKIGEMFSRRHAEHSAAAAVAAVRALVAAALAYVINQLIAMVWFRPRPFVTLRAVNKLTDTPATDKSFPSDHTAISFALAFSVVYTKPAAGAILFVGAAIVALGRVFVGVHYPSDILAGAAVGCFSAWVTRLAELRFRGLAPLKEQLKNLGRRAKL